LQGEPAPVKDAFRLKAEARAPREHRNDLAQRATIEAGLAEERQRPGKLQGDIALAAPFRHGADQAPQPRVADEASRLTFDIDPDPRRMGEEGLHQREVGP
jgi:hypothetical protein